MVIDSSAHVLMVSSLIPCVQSGDLYSP